MGTTTGNESDSTCGIQKLINLQAKKGCETKSSACPTQRRHLVWTFDNPELLRERDQRCIDQTISVSAAYNDAQLLFKSVLCGIAFVCVNTPRCHGLMCWHRATSGESLTLYLCIVFCFPQEEKGKRRQRGEAMTARGTTMANTGEIKTHQRVEDKRRYDGNLPSE